MVESEKELERREKVFRVLDDLQSKGERINADKVARLAQMGKQTILPHYNEWRFLDEADRDSDDELPADLVRVLKRGLIQWKHEIAAEQRAFQEQANQEIDELQAMNRQLSDERLSIKEHNEQLETEKSTLLKQHEEASSTIIDLEQQLIATKEKLNAETEKSATLSRQMEEIKQEHINALQSQERQLDTKHDAQINHWMKVVDDERRLRADTERQLKQEKDNLFKLEKERNDLSLRLESKSHAHLEACEERNQLKTQNQALAHTEQLVNSVLQLTGSNESELLSVITQLKEQAQQLGHLNTQLSNAQSQIKQLNNKLNASEASIANIHRLEMALEKERGFSEALKLSLTQKTAADNSKTNNAENA